MSAPIKLEPGSSSSSAAHIKQEPGASHIKSENPQSPASASFNDDDELYEDAGDLDILAGQRAVWLVKLPQFLAERWKDIDEDEEIVLGTVRVDTQAPSDKQVR
jgi:transcription initiation factor TFIIF subunit beta